MAGPRLPPAAGRAIAVTATALALLAPVLGRPRQAIIGSPTTDTAKHAWTLWAGREVWTEHGRPWGHTDLVNHPAGLDFFVIEPLGALVAAALPFLDIVLVANLLSLLNLLALGAATGWMADRLGARHVAGTVVAVLAMTAPVTAWFFHLGVGELQHLFFLPLVVGLGARLHAEGRWRDAVALGLVLGLTALSGFYLGLFAATAITAASIGWLLAGPHRLRLLSRLVPAAALALAVVTPAAGAFGDSWAERGSGFGDLDRLRTSLAPPVESVELRLDLAALLWPVAPVDVDAGQLAYVGGTYLGPVLLVLAAVGLWRRPRVGAGLAAAAAAAVLLAAGSHPVWLREELWVEAGLVLPWRWVNWLLEAVAVPAHYPVRFLAAAAVPLLGLAALSLDEPRGRRWVLPAFLLAGGLQVLDTGLRTEPGLSWPVTPAPDGWRELSVLAEDTDGAVLDLQMLRRPDKSTRNHGCFTQPGHGLPVPSVPISRLDDFHADGARRALAVPLVGVLHAFRNHGAGPTERDEEGWQADLGLLHADGFRWVLLTAPQRPLDDPGPPMEIAAGARDVLDSLLGPPAHRGDDWLAWRLPAPDPDRTEAIAARAALRDRQLAQPEGEHR